MRLGRSLMFRCNMSGEWQLARGNDTSRPNPSPFLSPGPSREFSWVSCRDPWQDVIEFAATSPRDDGGCGDGFQGENRRGERPRVMRKSQSPPTLSRRDSACDALAVHRPEGIPRDIWLLRGSRLSPPRNVAGIVSACDPPIKTRALVSSSQRKSKTLFYSSSDIYFLYIHIILNYPSEEIYVKIITNRMRFK